MKLFVFLSIVFGALLVYLLVGSNRPNACSLSDEFSVPFIALGIDVSHHQSSIDWEMIFSDSTQECTVDFVYLKATEGADHIDRQWERNRSELQRLKILHGAYHFYRLTSSAMDQVEHFLSVYQPNSSDLPPVLDMEIDTPSDRAVIIESLNKWLLEVEVRTGRRPVIYTSYSMYHEWMKDNFPNYRFWIAAYNRKYYDNIVQDDQIIHWQFSENGKLNDRFHMKVDMNVSKNPF